MCGTPIVLETVRRSRQGRIAFTIPYAAPEMIAAHEADTPLHDVQPAADVLALGLIAFEMLTSECVFAPSTSSQVIFDALSGRSQLP